MEDLIMSSNDKEFLVQSIRTQYTGKEFTALDELKSLDRKVKRPAKVFSYVYGSISALIIGTGMSLVMTDIGTQLGIKNSMAYGIVIGIAGIIMALINYPIHKKILNSGKKKYVGQIINLSDKAMLQQ
jgi:4-hydroxy-L-threonine phosphate dehydrogenase PdxA